MKLVTAATAILVGVSTPSEVVAQETDAGRWTSALNSARWTGPLLAPTAETLPQGHVYAEPYFIDSISGGEDHFGSTGFYQYGLSNNYTIGFQPVFALGTQSHNRNLAIGDLKLLSQLRLSHFKATHRVPSVSIVMNLVVPTGKADRLGVLEQGHGHGAFAPQIGVYTQHYFLLRNKRLLRLRLDVVKDFPLKTGVTGRSVYGTLPDFTGTAKPGSRTTVVAAAEYSVSREWVLALDVQRDQWGRTEVAGRNGDGTMVKQVSPRSWNVGFAPAIEYNWSDRAGAILGVWIVPKGHNSQSSVTPAIAIQRFW